MNIKEKISFILYCLLAVILCAVGLRYFFCSTFLSYHQQVIGTSWENINPGLQLILNGSLKMIGGGFVTLSAVTFILLFIPFKRGELWVRWAIPSILVIWGILCLYINLSIAVKTHVHTPWPASIAGLIIVLIAFFLSGGFRKLINK